MPSFVDAVMQAILGLHGLPAYAVVCLLAFGESAAFAGLLLPGEMTVVVGGVLASQQRVSLGVMLVTVTLAAALGDQAGYALGRRYGQRFIEWGPVQRRFSRQIERGRAYVHAHGGRAVLLGRWVGVLRAVVPALAGAAEVPYRRFLPYAIAGAVAWTVTFLLLGYAVGRSYHQLEQWLGPATLVLLLLIGAVWGLRRAVRAALARQERLEALTTRVLDTPPLRWLRGRYPAQVRWLRRRLSPRWAGGLRLTVVILALAASLGAAGAVLSDVLAGEELALLDGPVYRWFVDRRSGRLVAAARGLLVVSGVPGIAGPTLALALIVALAGRRPEALRLIAAVAGAGAIAVLLQLLIGVSPVGTRFPSAATASTAALATSLTAAVGAARGWADAGRAAVVAGALVIAAALAALLTAQASLSGVLAGLALGTSWALALEVVALREEANSAPG